MKAERFADAVVDLLKRILAGPTVAGRFDVLEKRIADLEARPIQKWGGVHVSGTKYAEATLTTRGGSLWAATTATTTTPGAPGSEWRLIVKRGDYDDGR